MRAIFRDCLPIGEHTKEAEDYFNGLEKVICTNDFQRNPNPLDREQFEHDEPDVQYTYISDALFKERSSRLESGAVGQDMEDQSGLHTGEIPQLTGEGPPCIAPIPEYPPARDLEYGEPDGDNSSW